ncbi:hypothetical protein [Streptomyces sp. NPDC090131]|uniref:hypothetical protein n=1 Tax=Streptomyces sp. NPDC090131 TaxID=3365954 RepID=UPI0037F68CCE
MFQSAAMSETLYQARRDVVWLCTHAARAAHSSEAHQCVSSALHRISDGFERVPETTLTTARSLPVQLGCMQSPSGTTRTARGSLARRARRVSVLNSSTASPAAEWPESHGTFSWMNRAIWTTSRCGASSPRSCAMRDAQEARTDLTEERTSAASALNGISCRLFELETLSRGVRVPASESSQDK